MDYPRSVVWEKAMQLAAHVLAISKSLPREERFGLRSQMTRAATSVPSNIAEGWMRESRKEKVQFFAIAHGSLAELHTQLLLCFRAGMLPKSAVEPSLGLVDEIGRILTVLKRRWRSSPATAPSKREQDRSS